MAATVDDACPYSGIELNHMPFHLLRVFSNIIQQILINYILEKFLRKVKEFMFLRTEKNTR
jgi:hypothetical protein